MSEPLAVREAPASYQVVLESLRVRPGYKQTEVGVIPEDWDARAICDDIDLLTGFPFSSSGYAESGIRLLRGSNVKRGRTDWLDDITQYWPLVTQDITRYELKEGDLVIAMDGSLVGRSSAQLTTEDLPALLLQRVARIRSTKKLDVSYLSAFVGSDWFVKHSDAVKTVTAIPHISPADIRSFTIPIPPTIDEQRAIAAALSDVGALIASLDNLIAKKRDLKQAAMQQFLTGQTRLPGFSGEWEVKRLRDIAHIQRGASPRPIDSPVWFDDNSPVGWVRISDVTRTEMYLRETSQRLSTLGIQHSRPVGRQSLIMSICATVGRPVITEIDTCIHDGFVVFDFLQADKLFVYYVLKFIENNWGKYGQTGSQMNLNTGLINRTEIALPTATEQTAIATVLSDMDAEIAALEARRDKTRTLKQGHDAGTADRADTVGVAGLALRFLWRIFTIRLAFLYVYPLN